MEWTLSKIRSKVRSLIGMPDTNQISNSDILDEINHFLQFVLPYEIKLKTLKTWYEMDTVLGTGAYSIDVDMLRIRTPITVDGVPVNKVYVDADQFFSKYPRDNEGSDTYNTPSDILLYDDVIYLRPIPDDVYTVRVSVADVPTALENDDDTPQDEAWGALIAYGTAMNILSDNSDFEASLNLNPYYIKYKDLLISKQLSYYNEIRTVPEI
jgi:hypothetical protein